MENKSSKKLKVLICSVHFGAGHTAHLNAYNKMVTDCGYEAALYLNEQYISLFRDFNGIVFTQQEEAEKFQPDIVWIWNVGLEDIKIINRFKKTNAKIVYVLHEPYMGFRDLLTEGKLIIRKSVANFVNFWICSHVGNIILCSNFAVEQAREYVPGILKKSIMFPLLYMDDFIPSVERKYFSLIGAYSHPHGSDLFLDFMRKSKDNNDIYFQIATRTNIEEILKDPTLEKMMKSGRLIVQQGRPLTEQEMNEAYRRSICTWNGYRHCMQSGVLANSFMQGTPVMATHLGSFDEYVQDGKNGVFIDDFSYDSIFNAFQRVKGNMDEMVENARNTFLTHFYYRNQEEKFKEIVEKLVK